MLACEQRITKVFDILWNARWLTIVPGQPKLTPFPGSTVVSQPVRERDA